MAPFHTLLQRRSIAGADMDSILLVSSTRHKPALYAPKLIVFPLLATWERY